MIKLPKINIQTEFVFGLLKIGICLVIVSWLLIISPKVFALKPVPQRIISGIPSATEMLFALGLDQQIVGITKNCNFPPKTGKKEKVGGFFLNLEKVMALRPDLIVMLESAQARDIDNFKSHQLPVYTINPNSVEEVMHTILALGKKTGTSARAKEIVYEMGKRIERIKTQNTDRKKPRVLVAVGYKPLIVAGANTFIDDEIRYAGGENIAGKSNVAYPQYSFEELIKQDPNCIIFPEGIVKMAEIKHTSPWQNLSAVREGKLLFIDPDILSRPGPRLVMAIEKMAEFIHDKKK